MSATTPRTPAPRPPRQLSGVRVPVEPVAPQLALPQLTPPQLARLEVAEPAGVVLPVPLARAAPSVHHPLPDVPLAIPPGPAPVRDLLLPNVLIPGVSHSGAVLLAADLGRHPDVCLPGVKRIGHFTPLRYGRPVHTPLDEYERHFARWSGQKYRLEAGPDYFDGGAPLVRRVADSLPGARVVLVLRDPVQRLWASYSDKLARGRVPRAMGFESYVDRCLALRANGVDRFEGNRHFRTLSSGFYMEYLPAWLETFGRRARVVFTEDLRADHPAQLGALFDWLGLDPAGALPAEDDDLLPGEGYGSPDPAPVTSARRWWSRAPRQFDRVVAGVRALYADSNRDLAALLLDHGYGDLPGWLAPA